MSDLLFRPMRSWLCLVLAGVIGVGYAFAVLGWHFIDSSSEYWRLPEGYSGGPVDMRVILSGYFWFVQDAWRWPLFRIVQADGPIGANAALMDVVPILALGCKLLRGVTGLINPYPAWVTGCFGLNAVALTALVRAMGQRSFLAACTAAAMAAMAPLMHMRFGHHALCAQWIFVFALATYMAHANGRMSLRTAGSVMIGLALLAFCTAVYLYVMTAAIAVAFFLQAMFDRRMTLVGGGIGLILVLASAAVPFWAFGLLGNSIAVETVPFGYASMNLMSPIWPQSSGVFAWTGFYALTRGLIGATSAQYEGYSYLGIGLLLLLAASLFRLRVFIRAIGPALGRHAMLAAALLVLSVWAISNTVYLGPVLLVSFPLPDALLRTVLAWFRAGGRFFWPVAWLVAAAAIAGVLKLFRPSPAVVLVAAAVALQAVDLSIWRSRLAGLVSNPTPSAFGSMAASAEIEAEVARRGSARVVPALLCSARPGAYDSLAVVAGIEVQLLAARQNAAMQSVVASRNEIDCAAERATPLRSLAGRAMVLVLAQPGDKDRRDEARQELSCRETPPGLICAAP